jgi:hypothetical protein
MAFYRGPKIITDGLVMYYDTDNVKSYVGEVTTNLLNNPSFEDGLLTSWSISNATGGTATIDTGRLDRYSMKVTVASAGDQYQTKGNNLGFNIAGRVFTISCYIKTSGIVGSGVHLATYWQNSVGAWIFTNNVQSVDITGDTDWTRITATSTAPALAYQVWFICAPTLKNGVGTYWIDDIQIEEKGHVTPFTVGTRSGTQGLLSLVKSNTVPNLNNISYDSIGNLSYNGSSNYIDFGINCYNLGIVRNATFCGWVYMTSGLYSTVISDWSTNSGMTLRISGSTTAEFYVYPNNYRATYTGTFALNTWYNLVGVISENDLYIYLNGILVASANLGESIGNSPVTLKTGVRGDLVSYNSGGKIPIVKIYNRALTSSEILQNFNTLKNRF